MDTRTWVLRGGILLVLGLVLVLAFEGVYPLPQVGALLSIAGTLALLAAVTSSILDR